MGTRQDVANVNAHFTYNFAIPASVTGGVFRASEVKATYLDLARTINYSVGCHAGFNLPDRWATSPGAGLDFAQAYLAKGSTYIANTGFGYGMDDSADLSELLMLHFQEELGAPDLQTGAAQETPIGWALTRAKQRYFNWVGPVSFGLYREKILSIATLYGLPMLRVDLPQTVPVPTAAGGMCLLDDPCAPTDRTIDTPIPQDAEPEVWTEADGVVVQRFTTTTGLARIDTADGSYFTWHNRSSAVPGRPIQPQTAKLINLPGVPPSRGAVLLSATYDTFTNWDPLIARPITDTVLPEPAYVQPGWWPTHFFAVNTLKTKDGFDEQIVMTPGQFSLPGTQRRYNSFEFNVYHSDNADRQWPSVWWTEASYRPDGIDIVVDTEDPSGIRRVLATYTDGKGQWQSIDLARGEDGLYRGAIAATQPEALRYFIQSVDNAGNVAVYTNKQDYFRALRPRLYLPMVLQRSASPPATAPTPAPTATPGSPAARITEIALNGGGYVVSFTTTGFAPQLPGVHLHFFFNTVPPNQAGVPGTGPWKIHGSSAPFTGYGMADRPATATQMCVLVANPDHTVRLGTGNCFDLPPVSEYAEITGIAVQGDRYAVHFRTLGYTPVMPGVHVHFFFDTVPPAQAGVPGAGPWRAYGGGSPYTGYLLTDRPAGARQVCILVANPNHSVRQNTGNCVALP